MCRSLDRHRSGLAHGAVLLLAVGSAEKRVDFVVPSRKNRRFEDG
jgi:hypothetical protein